MDSTVLGDRTTDHQKAFMELLGMAALHLSCIQCASYCISTGGLFQWRLNTGEDRAYSLDPADYPRLPLFTWMGPEGSTSLLNAVFWLTFDGPTASLRLKSRALPGLG